MMKRKLLIFALALSIFLISLGCAYAENETVMDDPGITPGLIVNNEGSFTDLQNEINNATDEITLNRNYTYNQDTDSDYADGVTINKTLTINGNAYTLNGNNQARILKTSGNIVLNNIKFINGYSKEGGAIYNTGTTIINNTQFTNNRAQSSGGAIFTGEHGTTNMTKCNFTNNTSINGGAISNWQGTININNTKLTNNKATYNGGAIYTGNNAITNITSTILANNNAELGGAIYSGNVGSGLDNGITNIINSIITNNNAQEGGATYTTYGAINIKNSTLKNNTAETGGAVYTGNYGTTNINSTLLANNTAEDIGGAAYTFSGATTNINNSTFTNNNAEGGGGAIYNDGYSYLKGITNINNSTFTNNNAYTGGAIRTAYGAININTTRFTNNSAQDGGAISTWYGTININNSIIANNTAQGCGGAIFNDGTININSSTLTNNRAKTGGAIYTNNENNVNVLNSKFINNTPDNINEKQKSDLNMNLSCQEIIFADDDLTVNISTKKYAMGNVTVTVDDTEYNLELTDYHAQLNLENLTSGYHKITAAYSGNDIYRNESVESEINIMANEGIYIINEDIIKLGDELIIDVYVGSTKTGSVSVTFNEKEYSLELINSHHVQITIPTVEIGEYEITASCVDCFNSTTVKIIDTFASLQEIIDNAQEGSTINLDHNYTCDNGQSITINKTITINGNGYEINGDNLATIFHITGRNIVLDNITFVNGYSTGNGGAIYVDNQATATITNTIITNNKANFGAAIYVDNQATATITNTILTNNTANRLGGAIYNYGTTTITDTIFTNNQANFGAAIRNSGSLTITDTTFTNNKAKYSGGAIYNDETATISKATFTKNTAGQTGGAIYSYKTASSLRDSTFMNNTAAESDNYTGSGSAIYCDDDTLSVINCTFDKIKKQPEIGISAENIDYGENLVITVEMPADVKYRPTVTVNGESKLVTLKNGTGSVKFSGLTVGTHTIELTYKGDTNYLKASANTTATVNKATPKIKITANAITYGEDLVVTVQLPSDVKYRPTVTINGESKAVTMKNGTGTVKFSGLTVGTHTIEVTYKGDTSYLKTSVEKTVKVTKGTPEIKITGSNSNDEVTIEIQMPSDISRRITVTFNGESKTVSLKDGKVSVKFTGVSPGTYTAEVTYTGDGNYLKTSANKTVKVSRYSPEIKVTAKSVSYGNDLTVEVQMPADVSRRVTLTIGNQTKTVSLKDGKATVKFSGLTVGTYNLEVSYAGDSNYLKASVNKTVKISKGTPDIEITAGDINVGQTLNVGVKLPADVTRRATISVGDQTKTISLKNGEANVKFTGLSTGTHEVTVNYAGDANYKASQNSTTINVK